MKKLVVAAAVVCAAVISQGAAMKWQSGTINGMNADGSFNSTAVGASIVQAVVWESASAISGLSAGDLYASYVAGTTDSLITGASVYPKASTAKGVVNVGGTTSYTAGNSVYAAILYVLTDGAGNDLGYIENYATATAGATAVTVGDLAAYNGGSVGGTPQGAAITGWTKLGGSPVPEPTSGLLMLLGVAGLALRRRRA